MEKTEDDVPPFLRKLLTADLDLTPSGAAFIRDLLEMCEETPDPTQRQAHETRDKNEKYTTTNAQQRKPA